jgi:para-aminobenzoate synthetase component I
VSDRWLVVESAADDPFERIERFLRDRGFGTGSPPAGVVADLYLGYGLAAALAGVHEPQPPEPCRLPLAACRVRQLAPDAPRANWRSGDGPLDAFEVGRFAATWTPAEHAAAVSAVREAIGRGDVYQVNVVQHLAAPFRGSPVALEAALAPLGAAWAHALHGDGWSIVSATPELFLQTRGRRARTMPIKGTRPAGDPDPIGASPKDRAEHVMIVDLERNDLGRVSTPGTVRVEEFLSERPMAGVRHMVSTVEGTLRAGVGLGELLRATFPGGSVTGAPKLSAIDHIARIEPVGRGASMGALGVVHPNGDLDLGLTIRTFAIADDRLHLWVGGGIVWDSDPDAEVEESLVKARPLLRLIGAEPAEGRP